MIAVGIIPARYAATRLPGKPLLPIAGKPMIQHVYEQARRAATLSAVLVATDDERIAAAVCAFGGEAIMTSASHRSGTDRLAEAARDLRADVIVNIQGDEPLIAPETIDSLVAPFEARPGLAMATLSTPILRAEDAAADSVVKVVVDRESYAIYFSRLPIPFYRDENAPPAASPPRHRKHIGLYAYRKEALMRFASLPPAPLEQAEALEQLRALEHGMRILVVPTAHDAISVDTPEDLERVRRLIQGVEEE
jgi:3-deoxy-manno-octulosonate cytidylyltransferase (CMP-KDO synthetase)